MDTIYTLIKKSKRLRSYSIQKLMDVCNTYIEKETITIPEQIIIIYFKKLVLFIQM